MFDKKIQVGLAHLICTGLIMKICGFVLPCYVTCYYTCAANLVMLSIFAKLTYGCVKRKFLNEKIQPDNRAVLITGCDSGFGNGLAKRLDSKGYHVFASCLSDESEGAKELVKSCSNRIKVFTMNVKEDDSVEKGLKYVKDNLGSSEFWALVNNAGVLRGFSVELTEMEDFKESIEVNTFGVVRVTKAFLPLLRQFKGRVINVTSVAGKVAAAHLGPYTMSKFAATAFTECLRQEMLVWGVKVISIEPEFFMTPIVGAEQVLKRLEEVKSDSVVKEDYGEKYVSDMPAFFKGMKQFCSPKLTKVISDIELAISLKNPDTSYRPCRNNVFRLFYYMAEITAYPVKDLITGIYFYVAGFPVPKEASHGYLG